jgi:hypothetical protein
MLHIVHANKHFWVGKQCKMTTFVRTGELVWVNQIIDYIWLLERCILKTSFSFLFFFL